MNRQNHRKETLRQRSANGTAMAELPLVIWIIFIGFLFPLLIIASIGYRGTLLYLAADTCTRKAAKSPSYSTAVANSSYVLNTYLAPFSGITPSAPAVSVLVQPLAGGAMTVYPGKLAPNTVDTSKNLYFVATKVDANLSPLIQFSGDWMGLVIPGLTGPYHLTINTQCYAENPTGLSQ